jgi:hypothetical protein
MQIMVELTQEQEVQRSYNAAMDSVRLLEAGKPEDMLDEDWADCKQRNIDHLKLQLEKGAEFYGEHDLTPFTAAIAK